MSFEWTGISFRYSNASGLYLSDNLCKTRDTGVGMVFRRHDSPCGAEVYVAEDEMPDISEIMGCYTMGIIDDIITHMASEDRPFGGYLDKIRKDLKMLEFTPERGSERTVPCGMCGQPMDKRQVRKYGQIYCRQCRLDTLKKLYRMRRRNEQQRFTRRFFPAIPVEFISCVEDLKEGDWV